MTGLLEKTDETVKVTNAKFGREVQVKRVMAKREGTVPGPVMVLLGGIHGNEPAGVYAIYDVFRELEEKNIPVRGSIYGLSGNLKALGRGERFLQEDMNRIWLKQDIESLRSPGYKPAPDQPERQEQADLWATIENLLGTKEGPFCFVDLHTTSSQSSPFLIYNDSITNRKFSQQFPLPVILGMEEHLEGPLLSYINEIGHVAMGIESGQHEAPQSVDFHAAFIKLALVRAGIVQQEDMPGYAECYSTLANTSPDRKKVFEIKYRYAIQEGEEFRMRPGFMNFQSVSKDEVLADNTRGIIQARLKGRVFMPLYNNQGDDGFFMIRQVSKFWLGVSAGMRRIRFEGLLLLLPGVKRHPEEEETLVVNPKVARFLATDLFHLLGFRRKRKEGGKMLFTRRKFDLHPPKGGGL